MAELAIFGVLMCGLFITLLWQRVNMLLKAAMEQAKVLRELSGLATVTDEGQVADRDEGPKGPRIRGGESSWPPKPSEQSRWAPPEPKLSVRAQVELLKNEYAAAVKENEESLTRHDVATEQGRRLEATQWYGRHQRATALVTRLDARLHTLGWDAMGDEWIREPKDDAATPATEKSKEG